MRLDVIAPCYNERECVPLFFAAVMSALNGAADIEPRVIFIDDGSRDGTLDEIKTLAAEHPDSVRYISFSRNFGKEAAIYAGLKASNGELCVLMDADLQHPPSMLPDMIANIRSGEYDSCAACRENRRGEPKIRSAFSGLFYRLENRMSDVSIRAGATDFRMMTAQMRDSVVSLGEYERFTKGLFSWVGYKTKWLAYQNVERAAGSTKWSLGSLFRYAVSGTVAFSTAPLRVASYMGACITAAAFLYALFVMARTLIFGATTSGFATTSILILFLGGVIITLLGIIGEYIARIYNEVKRRPVFIARETNFDEGEEK